MFLAAHACHTANANDVYNLQVWAAASSTGSQTLPDTHNVAAQHATRTSWPEEASQLNHWGPFSAGFEAVSELLLALGDARQCPDPFRFEQVVFDQVHEASDRLCKTPNPSQNEL